MTKLNPRLPISVQTIHIDLVPVTAVAGELDMATDDVVWDEVRAQLETRPGVLVLDLSEVQFMGSAGINVLLQSHMEATQHGTRLVVVAPQESFVNRVLTIVGIEQVLDLHTDVRSAVTAG
ncbi:STAS domain-containing protein [Lentzea sp. NPDC004782]|uniref:STAS domain-containing protein n=1 Tax=Lentzea sp. NPDC004782 TaxID=3154458 RepID=UPI0033A251BC